MIIVFRRRFINDSAPMFSLTYNYLQKVHTYDVYVY